MPNFHQVFHQDQGGNSHWNLFVNVICNNFLQIDTVFIYFTQEEILYD